MFKIAPNRLTYIATTLTAACLLYANFSQTERMAHEIYPRRTWNGSIYSTHWLKNQLNRSDGSWYNWPDIGKSLKVLFSDEESKPLIATTAAGAITFYSDVPVYDLLGLNRREVSNSQIIFDRRLAGHFIIAEYNQLIKAGVNLVVWHASAICPGKNGMAAIPSAPNRYHPLRQTRTLLLPALHDCYLIADYITPHPRVEELLANSTIFDYRSHFDGFYCPKWLCLI